MTLRRRTLAYLTLLLVGMTVILYLSLQQITISSFETVERAQIVRQATSLRDDMMNRQNELFNKVRDWASWTEMYDFVAAGGTDKAFIGDNLRAIDLATTGTSFMLMLDLRGSEVHWLSRIDDESLDAAVRRSLTDPEHPTHGQVAQMDVNSFFILCENVPILLAIRPVLPSDEAGPAVGKLVWGYLLDNAAAAELSAREQIDISFKAVSTPSAANDHDDWLRVETTDTSITSVVRIEALDGFVEIRIDEPRDIIQQARLSSLHFSMAMVFFGVVLISGTLFLVDRMMLARVMHLSSAVKKIGKDPGSRISIDGSDEISTLTEAINAMLVDVAESHQALETLNLQLEARVKERTLELEAQDAQLRAIVDTMGEGLAYTVDGSIEVANPTLAQLIGFSREELIGRPFNQLTPKMDMTVTQMMLSSPNRYETKLLRKDGAMIDVAINATPVTMGDARKRRVVIVRDITEEKALKQQRDYFFARASHELRTPLSNIMTRLYLLERDPEQSARHLDVLNKVSHHMLNLLNDLLIVSRLEAGMGMQKRPLDLRQVLYDVVEMQRSEAVLKKIALEIEIPQGRLQILADPTRLTQALTNIVRNAILYTVEGGQVHVAAEPDPASSDAALIRVRDNGIGIDAEHLPHLFDPFFRVKEGGMGAGLGLYITQEIIHLHGGAITVESTPGVGTTFTIRLEIFPQPSIETAI